MEMPKVMKFGAAATFEIRTLNLGVLNAKPTSL
jgi:hypothetical protein